MHAKLRNAASLGIMAALTACIALAAVAAQPGEPKKQLPEGVKKNGAADAKNVQGPL